MEKLKIIDNNNELDSIENLTLDKEHYLQSVNWFKNQDNCSIAISELDTGLEAKSVLAYRKSPFNIANYYTIDRGPAVINTDALMPHIQLIINMLKKSDAAFVRCSPLLYEKEEIEEITKLLIKSGWKKIDETLSLYKTTLTIDLTQSIEDIRKSFRRSLKTQLNKSDKLGIEVEMNASYEKLNEFFKYFNEMASQRGLLDINESTQSFIIDAIKSNTAKSFLAYYNSKLLSGVILVKQGDRVIYEWGMNTLDPEYKTMPLAHKLHWEGIKWAKENGYKYYDFGGFWFDKGNDDPINYFKLGFTKSVATVTPEFYYVLKPLKFYIFQALQRLRKVFK